MAVKKSDLTKAQRAILVAARRKSCTGLYYYYGDGGKRTSTHNRLIGLGLVVEPNTGSRIYALRLTEAGVELRKELL